MAIRSASISTACAARARLLRLEAVSQLGCLPREKHFRGLELVRVLQAERRRLALFRTCRVQRRRLACERGTEPRSLLRAALVELRGVGLRQRREDAVVLYTIDHFRARILRRRRRARRRSGLEGRYPVNDGGHSGGGGGGGGGARRGCADVDRAVARNVHDGRAPRRSRFAQLQRRATAERLHRRRAQHDGVAQLGLASLRGFGRDELRRKRALQRAAMNQAGILLRLRDVHVDGR